jgi:threonine-phosphate decarboxylase
MSGLNNPYPVHGGQLRELADRFGIPVAELLDFSANINPAGPPPGVLPSLRASLDNIATLTTYPDVEQAELRLAIARYAGTHSSNVAVANGFVPLLETTLRTLQVRRCLLPVPAFLEYRSSLSRAGVSIVTHILEPGADFCYDPAELTAGDHDAILLANPQNPSGIAHSVEVIYDLASRARDKGIRVLLDEAFIDYIPQDSATSVTNRFTNLIVFRSVTKFHGMPGMRVAYAISNPSMSSEIRGSLPPWPITTLAADAVIAALGDHEYGSRSIAENAERRVSLRIGLQKLGPVVYPSSANYILFQIPTKVDPRAFWQHMIVAHRIVLRDCWNYEALVSGHFRAAIRLPGENEQLLAAIGESLEACRR